MNHLKILIADNELAARKHLASMITEAPDCTVIGEVDNGRDAVVRAEALEADVVLMDIPMPIMDGLEAARHLARTTKPPAVIFCTAHDSYALSAFEVAAIDYLLKPVRRERLNNALERVRRQHSALEPHIDNTMGHKQRSHLSVHLGGRLRLIPVEEIYYLQAEEKYVVVHHTRGEDLAEESLKSLENEFSGHFLRIHRNCLVAKDEFLELKRLPDGQVQAVLRHSGASLEVSRRCLHDLRERLKHL